MATWLTSDLHLNHKNIIQYSKRPFKDVTEMDNYLLYQVNKYVRRDDHLIYLGDFFFPQGQDYLTLLKDYRARINCENITFIWGNHDRRKFKEEFKKLFCGPYDIYREKDLICCHYSMRIWENSHNGSFHAYGHSHGTAPDDPHSYSMDVGVDNVCKKEYLREYRPILLEEFKSFQLKKEWKAIDHHGKT